jgi:hypothetical protein
MLDHRPGAGRDVDTEPHRMGRDDDVAVEHGSVDAVATHGLQRDLGGQFRLFDGIEDRACSTHRPIFGEGTARLAHEPHRCVVPGAAVRGVEEGVVEWFGNVVHW